MQSLTNRTVREIALELPVTTRVFEEYNIDYCCGGRRGFREACEIAGADPDEVIEKIELVASERDGNDLDWLTTANLRTLTGYIVDKHHVYLRKEVPRLLDLASKVAARHGEGHPELLRLEKLFNELCDELMQHLLKEEKILFPYIEDLERTATVQFSCFGSVQNPVNMMLQEHDSAGDSLKLMRETTGDYALPEGACPSYTALFQRLVEFEHDLHQHIHLENNLLFPKAIELEAKIAG